jgi:hypothetical protein
VVNGPDARRVPAKIHPTGSSRYFRAVTKAELLRFSIAFALIKVRLKRFKLGLSEQERYQVADDAVRHLRQYGAWKELDDVVEAPIAGAGSQRREGADGDN